MNDVLTSVAAHLLYGPRYRCVNDAGGAAAAGVQAARRGSIRSAAPVSIRLIRWSSSSSTASARPQANPGRGRPGRPAGGRPARWAARLPTASSTPTMPLLPAGRVRRQPASRPDPRHPARTGETARRGRRRRSWTRWTRCRGRRPTRSSSVTAWPIPEFALREAEFIYGLNRLNVALTRARSKSVVCLPRPLLEASPQVLDRGSRRGGAGVHAPAGRNGAWARARRWCSRARRSKRTCCGRGVWSRVDDDLSFRAHERETINRHRFQFTRERRGEPP